MGSNGLIRIEHGREGRWAGRLTQRPLPENDPSIEALSERERERLAETWILRAAMERRVADSFEIIRDALARRGADSELIALAARAIDDEYRHTELSRLVASRFAGRELPTPERLLLEPPAHKGASPALRDTLFVVGQCVLNETTATAFLETCHDLAEGALAKAALRELLSDEVEHGRMGWTHLASLDERTRAQVGRWMLPMAFLNLRLWKTENPYDPRHTDALTKHGAPPASVLHAALVDALDSLIVPGLRQLDIATDGLEAWLAAGADTDHAPTELVTG
ncbi:MAG: hypothetical protein JST00_06990 [Deltaproteobacteria bacterium]|nr:hypothetical protein [Deltaproteobacteria bacterium]